MNTKTNELHLIFGTGPLGKAVMRELVKQGKRVRMVNRSGKASVSAGVEVVKGDATDSANTKGLCREASVIYQCSQPAYNQWPALFPRYQTAILEGAAFANARLVLAENLYMYGRVSGPIREDLPYTATTRKGEVRARMAEEWMTAHKAGKVQATAGRASDFYGPEAGEQGAFGDRVIYPLLAGKKVSGLGNIDLPHTYTYIDDFGKGLVILGAKQEALGQAWHIPNAPTLTTRQMVTLFFEEAKLPPKIGAVPDLALKMLGLVNPIVREVGEMLYEFKEPFVVDHRKFEQAFGNISTPHTEAVRVTLQWFRAHNQDTAKSRLVTS
ncbi:MAG: NAD-dependent epimerase/dehydratase family protein [Chloroflexi bacterium]|nr:NAD-dependent epimerase/dehydratase family protein [Chloroflexota bacterium]